MLACLLACLHTYTHTCTHEAGQMGSGNGPVEANFMKALADQINAMIYGILV